MSRPATRIFSRGDVGDELFLIRRGAVRIVLPLNDRQSHHLGTFGRGAFFGEMAFLDGEVRSANAVAFTDTELYVLSRRAFDKFAEDHKKLGLRLMEGIASVLASGCVIPMRSCGCWSCSVSQAGGH
jgi:SulP family sulfate permease